MYLKPIKTDADYRVALQRLEEIFDAKPGTQDSDELEILVNLSTNILIKDYQLTR